MSAVTTHQLVIAALDATAALLFAVMAPIFGAARRAVFPDAPVLRRLPHPTWLLSFHYLVLAAIRLVPPALQRSRPAPLRLADALADGALLLSMPALRQIITLVTSSAWRPDRRWLALDYGPALVLAGLGAGLQALEPSPVVLARVFRFKLALVLYVLVMGALMLRQAARAARRDRWRAHVIGGLRRQHVVIWGVAVVLLAVAFALAAAGRGEILWPFIHVGVALLFLVPPVLMVLGMMVRGLLFALVMIAAAAGTYLGAQALVPLAGPALRPVLDLATVATLLLLLLPGQVLVREGIDRLVFRRRRRRGEALERFMQTLPPEQGVHECCRRALGELNRAMQLKGAAVLLADGTAIAEGTFRLERLREVWPRGAAGEALPGRLVAPEFGVLPAAVREALAEAEVLGSLAVRGPRRRWGDLLVSASLMRAILTNEDAQAFVTFADQLALVLDTADLLARTLAVERSLAHAEKLAAVGETAARIAHEIRNPVTAARSLAQQLAREPGAPFGAELSVILDELERVERQVAALLRFAREELRPEPTDLAELVRSTVATFRGRLAAAGIELRLDTREGVVARIDREKLRQVVVNLIENAIDALDEAGGPRRLAVRVAGSNGAGVVDVTDSGPGIPADALPHIFDPFFSLKDKGTGLGLAIARRTVEAHGGRIAAAPAPTGGISFRIEVPLV